MSRSWGDGQPCTASARIDISDARFGTKERGQEPPKESFTAPANSLTKKAPYKGLSADSEEKHEPAGDTDTAEVVELA